jgi:hypothetical protein
MSCRQSAQLRFVRKAYVSSKKRHPPHESPANRAKAPPAEQKAWNSERKARRRKQLERTAAPLLRTRNQQCLRERKKCSDSAVVDGADNSNSTLAPVVPEKLHLNPIPRTSGAVNLESLDVLRFDKFLKLVIVAAAKPLHLFAQNLLCFDLVHAA